jgi:tetratricopeptide (TPR) repeat protein
MARVASLGPTVLYNQARTFYAQGKYWDAFFVFGKILTEYPDFFKNDWVQLHLGLCQEQLDMREYSTENFMETKKSFPRSEVVYHADLGILRLHYRDGNSIGVANQFSKLNTDATPDSLKYHAYYFTGLQHMKDGNFENAILLFDLIPQSHPEYVFAQFSSAIASASGNDMNNAVIALHDAIQFPPVTKAQEEIINRALTLLGYIFFEGIGDVEPSLSQAVAALRKVPPSSYYYEDAQLGLAWAALRASNWGDCIKACDEIIKTSKKTILHCEAMLLKGYCSMINNKYKEAVTILSPAHELITKTSPPSERERESATERFYDIRGHYYKVATSMNELAYTGQSSYIIKQIDSLHAPQVDYEKQIKNYYKYNDEFNRLSFFSKNYENLRNDIEYALAKSEKMSGMSRVIEIQKEAGEEIEKIDDKIEKYEEELKQLDKQERSPVETPEQYEQPPVESNEVLDEQENVPNESGDIYQDYDGVFEEQQDSEEDLLE